MAENWFHDLFINEAKPALERHSGGGDSIIDDFISGNLTDLNSNAESISDFALAYMSSIKKVSFPKAKTIGQSVFVSSGVQELYAPQLTTIGNYTFSSSIIKNIDLPLATSAGTAAFKDTTALTNVNLPSLTKISNNMFESSKLNELHVPLVTSVGTYAFKNAHRLVVLDLPKISGFPSSAFQNMGQLRALVLRTDIKRGVVTCPGAEAFTGCYHMTGEVNSTYNPNGLKDGYIYVPSSKFNSYTSTSSSNNWVPFIDQFRVLEDYTIDGTTTGALDLSKI